MLMAVLSLKVPSLEIFIKRVHLIWVTHFSSIFIDHNNVLMKSNSCHAPLREEIERNNAQET